jgi:hypothetical protein
VLAAHVSTAARWLVSQAIAVAAAGYAMSGTEIRTTHVIYDRAGKLDVQCGEQQQRRLIPQLEDCLCCKAATDPPLLVRSVQSCMRSRVHAMDVGRNAAALTCRWHNACARPSRPSRRYQSTAAVPSLVDLFNPISHVPLPCTAAVHAFLQVGRTSSCSTTRELAASHSALSH